MRAQSAALILLTIFANLPWPREKEKSTKEGIDIELLTSTNIKH